MYVADVPCAENNCLQGCANIDGSETCFCMPGYQLDEVHEDNDTCSGMVMIIILIVLKRVFQILMNVLIILVIITVLTLMAPLHVHVMMDMC